jgi:ATP-dependent exoDNAse (exonuclease V) beta subunit
MSAYASQMSAWEVLSEILVQTQLDARLSFLPHSRQLIANARKLLEVAGERKDLSPMAFAEWIDRQQRLRGDFNDAPIFSDQAEAVRIATVHNAKGLEWDVVVVLVRSPIQRNYEEVLLDPESNLPVFSPKKEACLFWRIVCAQEQQNEKEEELRLLYVAMTRAKKRLCLAVLSGTHSDYWHSIIVPSLLDRPLPDLRVRDFGGGVK